MLNSNFENLDAFDNGVDNFTDYVINVSRYKNGVKRLNIINVSMNLTASNIYELGTLPEEYKPTSSLSKMVTVTTSGHHCFLFIGTDGKINIRPYANITSGTQLYICEFYV